MSDSEPPDPLARLGERLDRAQARPAEERPAGPDQSMLQQGMGLGFRIGIEFVVAVVVATGLGWAIDRWAGTRPWGTIVLFFLGVGAGMTGVYRAVTGVRTAVGYGRPPAAGKWDDDED